MSRVQVIAVATDERLVLQDGTGDIALEATPRQTISIGNSIGGYLVAPMPNKTHTWGFWRVTGNQRHCLQGKDDAPIQGVTLNGRPIGGARQRLVERILSGQPERVAVNGRRYLLATSSGSARNGVLHAYRPDPDPIRRALTIVGCDKNTGTIASSLDQAIGEHQGHYPSTVWSSNYALSSDGSMLFEKKWLYGSVTMSGCMLDALNAVGDATYVVALYEGWDGASADRTIRVYLAENADRRKVAEAVLSLVHDEARLGTVKWRKSLTPVLLDK